MGQSAREKLSASLEDYLEARPGDRERIRRQVEAGALSIGPWYVLPDEFLVSAEATVRNLHHGHEVCRELGGAQKVGYLPDSFGHIAQMPQILRKAGIDSFFYTRGNGAEIEELGLEYAWSAEYPDRWDPDCTGVLWGRQHHTLDMELFGPNAWLTGFYLRALKAAAQMAVRITSGLPE